MENELKNEEIDKNKKDKKTKLEKEIEKLENKLQEVNKELLIQIDKSSRAQAELINYKKRKDDEVAKNSKYANSEILLELLSIVDNFESAIKMAGGKSDDEQKFLEGFKLICNQLEEILNINQVNEIESLEKTFNPQYHQAVMVKENKSFDDGIILEVFQKGYMYKDRLLRPSMVVVNKLEMKGKEENE